MKSIKAQGLLAAFLLSLTIAGCGAADKPITGNGGSEPTSTPAATQAEAVTEAPATEAPVTEAVHTLKIYSADAELTKVNERQVEVTVASDGAELELVKAAITELQKDGGEDEYSLWKKVVVNEVALSEGQVKLDIHLPDEARLGAPGEQLAIETLTKTLFQFEFVTAVDILVDGEAVETMMGHVELEHPYFK